MVETVQSLGYAKKLGKYGFNPRLCASKEQCEEWLDFCKKTDMIWFKNSYGTLVHKDFDKHFIRLEGNELIKAEIELAVMDDSYHCLVDLNHSNGIKSKVNDVYFVTSSPNYVEWSNIEKYPHTVFIIHPSLLEDYGLNKINFAFSNASYDEINEINEAIYEDIGLYEAFRYLHEGNLVEYYIDDLNMPTMYKHGLMYYIHSNNFDVKNKDEFNKIVEDYNNLEITNLKKEDINE